MTQTRADRSADLTSGPMLQKIILFSIPLAASSILQLLFNAADVVVVGRFAGSTALAAVGSNGSLINLLVNLFVGLSLGANVVAARCFGAKDDRGVQDTVQTSVTLGFVSGVLLVLQLLIIYAPFMQMLFGTTGLPFRYWVITFIIGFAMFLIVELEKPLTRKWRTA